MGRNGFSSDDLAPAPPPALVQARQRDAALLDRYAEGVPLPAIAQELDYPTVKAVTVALRRALRALDRRLGKSVGEMRAAEFLRLEGMDAELRAHRRKGDVKVVNERRLLSESRRRLYGMDLEAQVEDKAPTRIEINFGVPPPLGERPVVVDGEYEEVAQIESGEPEDAPPAS